MTSLSSISTRVSVPLSTATQGNSELATPITKAALTPEAFQLMLDNLRQPSASTAARQLTAGLPLPDTSTSGIPSALPALNGTGNSSEMWVTLLMMQLLERVIGQLDGNSANNPAPPTGQPVTGPISQEYHAGHEAIDLAVPVGTPVRATMSGRVTYSGWNTEGYGNLVIVDNGPYQTYYAHLSQLPLAVGAEIQAGELVGYSGNTGNSTGPHVHYEVRLNGDQVPPVT